MSVVFTHKLPACVDPQTVFTDQTDLTVLHQRHHLATLTHWLTDLTVNWSQLCAVNCCSSPAGQWRHVDSITAVVTADNCWVSVSANRLPAVETPDTRQLSLLTSTSLNLLLQTHHCVYVCVFLSFRRYLFIIFQHLSPPTQHVVTVTNKKANRRKKSIFIEEFVFPVVTMTTPYCQWCRWL